MTKNNFSHLTAEDLDEILESHPELFESVNEAGARDENGEFWRLRRDVLLRRAKPEGSA